MAVVVRKLYVQKWFAGNATEIEVTVRKSAGFFLFVCSHVVATRDAAARFKMSQTLGK